ncbi:MAG: hypothetical protein ACJASQ_002370 [Crocinitomicaceae bacterium]|jgi:hypothetical protein
MKTASLLILFAALSVSSIAQHDLPVLRTNTSDLSINDGNSFKENYWTIDPALELDVYVADKTIQTKSITFYSDIDTVSFQISLYEKQNFLVILNDTDTCLTQIKSGITFINKEDLVLTHDTIPFILTESNNIIIQTVLNEVDTLNLMFHTAQGAISLTEDAVKKITNKSFDNSQRASTWGGESETRYSLGNYLKINDFEWHNVTIWEDQNTGPSADGKFGPNLFQDKVIELNFDENLMIIHSYLPELDESYKKLDLQFKEHMMYVETKYKIENNDYTNQVLIHSGSGGTLLLDNQFVHNNDIDSQLETISESHLKDSYGNILKTKKAILPSFSIGQTSFTDMPISFFEGALGKQRISVIGGNILKRFNVYFDLQNAQLYYTPSQLIDLPFGNS